MNSFNLRDRIFNNLHISQNHHQKALTRPIGRAQPLNSSQRPLLANKAMSFHASVLRAGSKAASSSTTFICTQCRNATLLRRPKRPYTFTQLIALSDGSTFTHRTTSPQAVYRSTRDTRNALLWNPSSEKLLNLEDDEAGRLAAFRSRYGRGWDSTTKISAEDAAAAENLAGAEVGTAATPQQTAKALEKEKIVESEFEEEDEDSLLDLISSFGQENPSSGSKKK